MKPTWTLDLVGLGAAFAVAAGLYLFDIAPTVRRSAFAKTEIEQLNQTYEKLASQQKVYRASQARAAATTQELSELFSLRPAAELNTVLGQLNDTATHCSVQIESVEAGEARADETRKIIPISIRAKGGYEACANWMANVRQTMPDIGIANFDISTSKADRSSVVQLSAELSWAVLSAEKK